MTTMSKLQNMFKRPKHQTEIAAVSTKGMKNLLNEIIPKLEKDF